MFRRMREQGGKEHKGARALPQASAVAAERKRTNVTFLAADE